MKNHIKCLLATVGATVAFAGSANAAVIDWGTGATDSANVNDIDVTGETVVYAMNGGDAAAGVDTVTGLASPFSVAGINFTQSNYANLPTGVTFAATGTDAADSARARWVNDRYNFGSSSVFTTTGDSAYDYLLQSSTDSFGTPSGIVTGTMTFAGLVDGQDYQIQVWYNEPQGLNAQDGRVMRYGDGSGNTVDVAGGNNDGVTDGDYYGQYAIGTFTAAGTTQALTMEAVGFGNVHYTALLIQEVPEPGSLALLGLGGLFTLRRRRK